MPIYSTDWLYDTYGRRPERLATLIDLAERLPLRWNADQELEYRESILGLVAAMVEIIESPVTDDLAREFHDRLAPGVEAEIQRFVVYLVFVAIPEGGWPEQVVWIDGKPHVQFLEDMLHHAEATVLAVLAKRLREQGEAA